MSELANEISEAIDATTNHAEVIDRVIDRVIDPLLARIKVLEDALREIRDDPHVKYGHKYITDIARAALNPVVIEEVEGHPV